MHEGLDQINGITKQRETLKHMITMHVKGLDWPEYYTPWSNKGVQFGVEYLKEHLLNITNDSALKEKEVKQPRCFLPARKTLPTLGARAVDVRTKDKEDRETNGQMRLRTCELRLKLIDNGRRDEMKLRQPIGVSDLKEGMRTQHAFVHKDDNANEDSAEWCTGTIVRVSDGKNLETIFL